MRCRNFLFLVANLSLFTILMAGTASATLSCGFNPVYQESGLRDVFCNFTDAGVPVTNANITDGTYDTNDWYKNGVMSGKSWIIGYQNINNISAVNYTISSTSRIDSIDVVQVKFGPFTYPFVHINQSFNFLAKAGSDAGLLHVFVCNDTYTSGVFSHTPVIISSAVSFLNCALAAQINRTVYNVSSNWTWISVDTTNAYNNITAGQAGLESYSIYLTSNDTSSINPVNFNETLLIATYDTAFVSEVRNDSEYFLPKPYAANKGFDEVNMTNNVALYHMDALSGNIIDYSGNGLNGVPVDIVKMNYNQSGRINLSVNFTNTANGDKAAFQSQMMPSLTLRGLGRALSAFG